MGIERKPTRRMKVASVLTDAKPSFISLVDHGANQTPFNVVKAHAMSAPTEGTTSSTSEMESTMADPAVSIRKITFDTATFADPEAVKAYLTKAGFDADVAKDGDVFVAKSNDLSDDEELTQIEAEKGVLYFVAKQVDKDAEDTQKSANTEEVAKSFLSPEHTPEEVVAKYDAYLASWSDDKSLQAVLKEGADGLPIGIFELNDAFYNALRNNLIEGDYAGAQAVINEFGNLVIRLSQAIPSAVMTGSGDITKSIWERPAYEVIEAAAKEAEEAPEGDEQETEVTVEGNPAEGTIEKEATPEATEGGTEPEEVADLVAKGFADMTKAFTDAMKGMTDTLTAAITKQGEEQKAQVTELKEAVTKTAGRVDGLENRTQTRKSADAGDDPDNTAQQPTVKKGIDPLIGNTLGFRRT